MRTIIAGVSPARTFLNLRAHNAIQVRDGEDAIASTRDARATQALIGGRF